MIDSHYERILLISEVKSWSLFCTRSNSLTLQSPLEKVPFALSYLVLIRVSIIEYLQLTYLWRGSAYKLNEMQHLCNLKTSDISERQSNG